MSPKAFQSSLRIRFSSKAYHDWRHHQLRPGVNNSQGEGHRTQSCSGFGSTAGFFIDGARDDVQYYRPLYNPAQVEVLRGPNAAFWSWGTDGVLNRVTKKALLAGNSLIYSRRTSG